MFGAVLQGRLFTGSTEREGELIRLLTALFCLSDKSSADFSRIRLFLFDLIFTKVTWESAREFSKQNRTVQHFRKSTKSYQWREAVFNVGASGQSQRSLKAPPLSLPRPTARTTAAHFAPCFHFHINLCRGGEGLKIPIRGWLTWQVRRGKIQSVKSPPFFFLFFVFFFPLQFHVIASYPRVWNMPQSWQCEIEVYKATYHFIYAQKNFFTGESTSTQSVVDVGVHSKQQLS